MRQNSERKNDTDRIARLLRESAGDLPRVLLYATCSHLPPRSNSPSQSLSLARCSLHDLCQHTTNLCLIPHRGRRAHVLAQGLLQPPRLLELVCSFFICSPKALAASWRNRQNRPGQCPPIQSVDVFSGHIYKQYISTVQVHRNNTSLAIS